MVDIKRQDITLSDWTKWISADEFTWGSYFYSEGIQTWYSTKWFKLWPYLDTNVLNYRATGRPVSVVPTIWNLVSSTQKWFIAFTYDGKMEMNDVFNGGDKGTWVSGWGAIFSENTNTNRYWGGIVYWDYALGITTWGSISKVDYKNIYDIAGQTITDPNFSDWGTGWTIGSWWTLTDNWAEHTTWETWTLETTANAYTWGRARIAIKISDCTDWKLNVAFNGTSKDTDDWKNWWFTFSMNSVTSGSSYTLTITPTSDFDGTIAVVNFNVFDSNYFSTISWLGASSNYQALVWQWDIYIGYWSKVNILSTTDWTVWADKNLIDSNETIVALTQQAWSLIIWATDGMNSKQYYWDWVSDVASEVIEWKWQVIKWVVGTETVAYVLSYAQSTDTAAAFRLYSVNGYQRSLIASNSYNVQLRVSDYPRFHRQKKFVFNNVEWPQSMCVYLDNLYIPGCNGIYQFGQTLPWLWNAWSRPVKFPTWSDKVSLLHSWDIWMTYRLNQVQYYGKVESDYNTYNWYLITESIYWDKLSSRKAIQNMKIWYKSIPSVYWNIKIYAIVDDDYFWRFDVTWITTRPAIWDVYEVARDTTAEIISIEKSSSSAGIITFKTVSNGWSLFAADTSLTRVSWSWDASISVGKNYDNMVLVKTIETDKQEYGSDFIFGKDFVNSYIPYWHKIQLVIELNKLEYWYNKNRTPEIYEITMVADITDTVL